MNRPAEKSFTCEWVCKPKTSETLEHCGTEVVSAENLLVACMQVRKRIASRYGCTVEQVEVVSGSFQKETK